MKKCSECSIEKENSYFPINGNKCLKCISFFKKRFSKNEISECRKSYYENNKDVVTDILENYYNGDSKNIKNYKRRYNRDNFHKENILENNKGSKIESNLIINGDELTRTIKSLISLSFRKKFIRKPKRTIEILGINYDDFKKYLESKFTDNMNWSNFNILWKIDYIEPIPNIIKSKEIICSLNKYTNFKPVSILKK